MQLRVMIDSYYCRSQAGPVNACSKVLRSVLESGQCVGEKSAGVLLVQADTSSLVRFTYLAYHNCVAISIGLYLTGGCIRVAVLLQSLKQSRLRLHILPHLSE